MRRAEFIAKLVAAREDAGLTRLEIAIAVGVRADRLARWERQVGFPWLENARLWATVLGVAEPPELVGWFRSRAPLCGTVGGYLRHIKDGSAPCAPCRQKNAAASKAKRSARVSAGWVEPADVPVPRLHAADDWGRFAACLGVDLAIPFTEGRMVGFAKRYCVGCPVRRQCLDLAMRAEQTVVRHGVFGGLLPAQRVRLANASKSEAGAA